MSEKLCGIYCLENFTTGKLYIGSSVHIRRRWIEHFSFLDRGKHGNSYLQNAYNKYGKSDFGFFIIELAPEELLIQKENFWIWLLRANDREFGYNVREAAETNRGRVLTQAHKDKISLALKGIPRTEDLKRKMRERVITPEWRKNISEGQKGKKLSPSHVQKMSDYFVGKKRTGIVSSSPFFGVSISTDKRRWTAMIRINRKQVFLGHFETEIDAALAYNEAVDKYSLELEKNYIEEKDILESEKIKDEIRREKLKNKSSKYKGVHFCNTSKKFVAKIYLNGKNKTLGYFKNELDAAKAYNKAILLYFDGKKEMNNLQEV